MSKNDIAIPKLDDLPSEGDGPAGKAIAYGRFCAMAAHDWYAEERKTKRLYARILRFAVIIVTAIAGIIPLIAEMGSPGKWFYVSPGWSSIFLAVAGAIIGFDKFFGLSTGWLRFTDAMTRIRSAIYRFDLDLLYMKEACPEKWDADSAACNVIDRCRQVVTEVDEIVAGETSRWETEFRQVIQKIDAAAKPKEKETPKDGPGDEPAQDMKTDHKGATGGPGDGQP